LHAQATASFGRRSATGVIEVLIIVAAVVASAFAYSIVSTPGAFAGQTKYTPELRVDLGTRLSADPATTSTNYLVTGCGYNAAYGGVTIVVHSPEAISFAGQIPDENGCINVANFWTQGAGHYDVDAYQTMRRKSSLVASTGFDL
jgi:hypothetical protein